MIANSKIYIILEKCCLLIAWNYVKKYFQKRSYSFWNNECLALNGPPGISDEVKSWFGIFNQEQFNGKNYVTFLYIVR